MNAYELADALEKAVTFMRQQQAEIENLKRLTKEPTKLLVVDDVLRRAGYVKAKKEWQYLTNDEIKEIIGSYGNGIGGYTRELFDKIQAKIKEKNFDS